MCSFFFTLLKNCSVDLKCVQGKSQCIKFKVQNWTWNRNASKTTQTTTTTMTTKKNESRKFPVSHVLVLASVSKMWSYILHVLLLHFGFRLIRERRSRWKKKIQLDFNVCLVFISAQCGRWTDLCLDGTRKICAMLFHRFDSEIFCQSVPAKINKTRQPIYYPFSFEFFISHRQGKWLFGTLITNPININE